jgi:hypothetical protein
MYQNNHLLLLNRAIQFITIKIDTKFLPTECLICYLNPLDKNDLKFYKENFKFLIEDLQKDILDFHMYFKILEIPLTNQKEYKNDQNIHIKVMDSIGSLGTLILWGNQIKLTKLLNKGDEICIWKPFIDSELFEVNQIPTFELAINSMIFKIDYPKSNQKIHSKRILINNVTTNQFSLVARVNLIVPSEVNETIGLRLQDESGICDVTLAMSASQVSKVDLGCWILITNLNYYSSEPVIQFIDSSDTRIYNISQLIGIPASSCLSEILSISSAKRLKYSFFMIRACITDWKVLKSLSYRKNPT